MAYYRKRTKKDKGKLFEQLPKGPHTSTHKYAIGDTVYINRLVSNRKKQECPTCGGKNPTIVVDGIIYRCGQCGGNGYKGFGHDEVVAKGIIKSIVITSVGVSYEIDGYGVNLEGNIYPTKEMAQTHTPYEPEKQCGLFCGIEE